MQTIEQALEKLSRSKFRSRFRLKEEDFEYIGKIGKEKLRSHAEEFIRKRLAPAYIPNDGKQTPMRGHPVFKAQHATATRCRSCLEKWHGIPKGRALDEAEIADVADLITARIRDMAGDLSEFPCTPELFG